MTLPVSLQAVIDEMDTFGDEFHPYINQHTGELVTLRNEEIQAAEQDEALDDDSEWEPDEIQPPETSYLRQTICRSPANLKFMNTLSCNASVSRSKTRT